ncbi:MAG: SMP-30/gluconolactonase/LRE family protein [Devosia sp.]
MTVKVETAVASQNLLGEGAYWHARGQRLWWVDVPMPGARIETFDPVSGRHHSCPVPQMPMSLRARRDGAGLIVATHSGVSRFDPATGELTHLIDPEPGKPFNRSNDGGTDAKGRFWFGTMQNNLQPNGAGIDILGRTGTLFSLDAEMSLKAHETGIMISNTMCWSPDNRTLYFCDTATGTISAYDFDLDEGRISNKRPFAKFERGVPDGSTVDADGCLWNARWDGHCVVRFTPRGEVDMVVEVPAAKPTSLAFGGSDFSDLYITTARYGGSADELSLLPESGNLMVCRPGVTGFALPEFG